MRMNQAPTKDYEDYVAWSEDILTTAVFSIILTAPIGLIVINKLVLMGLSLLWPSASF